MRNDKIAVIGDKDSVLAFKAAGADVFSVRNDEEATEALKKAARSYPVIFITETLAERISETVSRYKARPFPAVIPLPSASGSTGLGMRNISENVEKALGTDILDKK